MTKHAEGLAKLGWQYFECPACGSEGARAFPKPKPNKDGSPCPEFWDWLPKAYNFDGNGSFTKYNMEVAFLAGKQASQPAPVAEPRKQQPLTDGQIEDVTRKATDALLDHIYEYGTVAEGINYRVHAIARAIEAAHGIYAPAELKENT